jgi:hypothetical protein
MLLHATIVPPRSALDAVAHAIRSVERPVAPYVPAKGMFGRLGGRGIRTNAPAVVRPGAIEVIPSELVLLAIAGFRNVTSADAVRLTAALNEAAQGWVSPTVQFAGGGVEAPGTSSGDRSLRTDIVGEVDGLRAVAQGVTQCVERLGFFVDRRRFRSSLVVATIAEGTPQSYVEAVVAALDDFRGDAWTVGSVSLMRLSFELVPPGSTTMDTIRIGPRVAL